MTILKPITKDGVPAALQKAERYRLLNDPSASESICEDVLAADPENQAAVVTLLLSITDQFGADAAKGMSRAREVLPRLQDPYKRAYYSGIIFERAARAKLRHGGAGSGEIAYDWFQEAMSAYEKAESMRPAGNDESILRWNTCRRTIDADPTHIHAAPVREYEPVLGE